MGIKEDWSEILFHLNCLQKGSAKRQFRHAIRYAWGGMCCFCRDKRATTVDHLKPKSKGGSDLRSNLVPCCVDCNHSKGSEDWLPWFQRQEFYNDTASDLIKEWIANKRHDQHEPNEIDDRATVCAVESEIRSKQDVEDCFGENCLAAA